MWASWLIWPNQTKRAANIQLCSVSSCELHVWSGLRQRLWTDLLLENAKNTFLSLEPSLVGSQTEVEKHPSIRFSSLSQLSEGETAAPRGGASWTCKSCIKPWWSYCVNVNTDCRDTKNVTFKGHFYCLNLNEQFLGLWIKKMFKVLSRPLLGPVCVLNVNSIESHCYP